MTPGIEAADAQVVKAKAMVDRALAVTRRAAMRSGFGIWPRRIRRRGSSSRTRQIW
ncbi:MAG: hypothetical protein U0231_04120 [Nitrospiraceae bacterium]